MKRTCAKCGGDNVRYDGKGYRCRPCAAAYMREFNKRPGSVEKKRARDTARYSRTKPARRASDMQYRFGLSGEGYQSLFDGQGGLCAVCRGKQNTKGKDNLSVDHCHATGEIRGLLCNSCNMAIGLAKDAPERLRGMASYLERSRGIAPPQIPTPSMLWHF